MNRLKKAAVKLGVSCAGLWLVWQVISLLPPIKNIQLPGGTGLTMDRLLETVFLTLIALAVWFQSRDIAAELEVVFAKVPVLRLLWADLRLFVTFFFLYRAYTDFLPIVLKTGAAPFSWAFFLILAFPIARIAWHGYHNLDTISDGNTWAGLQSSLRLCPKCGALNQSDAAFCRKCGGSLAAAAPAAVPQQARPTRCACGAEVPAADSFCAKCGRPPIPSDPPVPPPPPPKLLVLTCPSCSAEVSPGNQFCGKCGAKL